MSSIPIHRQIWPREPALLYSHYCVMIFLAHSTLMSLTAVGLDSLNKFLVLKSVAEPTKVYL